MKKGRDRGRGWSRDKRRGAKQRGVKRWKQRWQGVEWREWVIGDTGFRKHPVELCVCVCLRQHQATGQQSNNKRTMLIQCLG